MYNFLVSANDEDWNGKPFTIELNRYLEHTDYDILRNFKELNESNIDKIIELPCIFAYEDFCKKNPYFGFIQRVKVRRQEIRIQYEIIHVEKFLTSNLLQEMQFELDIQKWELSRTHWAIKNVNLSRELYDKGIILPDWTTQKGKNNFKSVIDTGKPIISNQFNEIPPLNLISIIQNDIEKGKIKEALNKLGKYADSNNRAMMKKMIIIMKSELSSIKRDELLDLIPSSQSKQNRNNLNFRILSLLDELLIE